MGTINAKHDSLNADASRPAGTARQALLAGDCDVAVVLAVTLTVWPSELIYLSESGLLCPQGQAKVFSKAADGFVPSEGCIAFVLSREDSDRQFRRIPVMGKLKGSGVAHSGKGAAMAAPNLFAQEALLRETLMQHLDDDSIIDVHEGKIDAEDLLKMKTKWLTHSKPKLMRPALELVTKLSWQPSSRCFGFAGVEELCLSDRASSALVISKRLLVPWVS